MLENFVERFHQSIDVFLPGVVHERQAHHALLRRDTQGRHQPVGIAVAVGDTDFLCREQRRDIGGITALYRE